MFEKYLKRVEPNLTAAATTTAAAPAPSQSTHDARVMRKRSKSKGSGVDKHLKLTAEQKCDIAQREIEELREEIDKLKEDTEKILDTYKVGKVYGCDNRNPHCPNERRQDGNHRCKGHNQDCQS